MRKEHFSHWILPLHLTTWECLSWIQRKQSSAPREMYLHSEKQAWYVECILKCFHGMDSLLPKYLKPSCPAVCIIVTGVCAEVHDKIWLYSCGNVYNYNRKTIALWLRLWCESWATGFQFSALPQISSMTMGKSLNHSLPFFIVNVKNNLLTHKGGEKCINSLMFVRHSTMTVVGVR